MQIVSKATFLAAFAVACCPPSMLIDRAAAVEVSGSPAPSGSPASSGPAAAISGPSPDSFVLGSRTFTIPFTVDAVGSQPVEVQLFVSRGPSDPWTLIQAKQPSQSPERQFEFTADADGEFWFATRTTNTTGSPQLASTVSPQLKVFVDTSKPYVELIAEADADGRVEVQLVIRDATPLQSLQLRYQTDSVRSWQDVDVAGLPNDGRLGFTPSTEWKQLSLQLIVKDKAGNQNYANKLVQLPRIAEAPMHRYAVLPGGGGPDARQTPYRLSESEVVDANPVSGPVVALDRHRKQAAPNMFAQGYAAPPSSRQNSFGNFRGAAHPTGQATTPNSENLQPSVAPEFIPPPKPAPELHYDAPSIYAAPAPRAPTNALPPPASLDQISNGFGLTGPQQPQSNNTDVFGGAKPETIPAPDGEADPSDSTKMQPIPDRTLSEAMRPLSERSAVPPQREDVPAPKPNASPNRGGAYRSGRQSTSDPSSLASRVPVRFSDSLRFSLAYELEAVGSQGVEAIELYGSVDEGRSWKLWGRDPDRTSPFDIETREEGVFGYRIVVVGNNGLASPRPQSGEAPDIVVVVDKQAPEVRVTGAQYGEGDRIGALVILYECADANLMARPISLSFSPELDGPWTTIAAGLPNSGDYVWPADPQLPRQFYLRIDATDQAGNVGTYILDRPIDAQGLAPRARIRGFQSISGVAPDASFK